MPSPKDQGDRTLDCPSAQADMPGARVFGIVLGTKHEPQVAYLAVKSKVDLSRLLANGMVKPTEAYRIAATCETSRCAHFDGRRCTLAQRIASELPQVVDTLPACTVRATCRWYSEQGAHACLRCPQIVTLRLDESFEAQET